MRLLPTSYLFYIWEDSLALEGTPPVWSGPGLGLLGMRALQCEMGLGCDAEKTAPNNCWHTRPSSDPRALCLSKYFRMYHAICCQVNGKRFIFVGQPVISDPVPTLPIPSERGDSWCQPVRASWAWRQVIWPKESIPLIFLFHLGLTECQAPTITVFYLPILLCQPDLPVHHPSYCTRVKPIPFPL